MNLLKFLFGTKNERELKKLWPVVREINRIEAEYQAKNFAEEDFPRMTQEFRDRVAIPSQLEWKIGLAWANTRGSLNSPS